MSKLKFRKPKYAIAIPYNLITEISLPPHRISVYCYLYSETTRSWHVNYSPHHMLYSCGYSAKIDHHKNRTDTVYGKFKHCMAWMCENNYIDQFLENEYTGNKLQSSRANRKMFSPEQFGLIYDFEYNALVEHEITYKRLNKSMLLLVLSYIRARCWQRKITILEASDSQKRRRPEVFYSLYKTIGEEIGIDPRLVSRAVDVLSELGVLATQELPRYQDKNGNWHTNDVIFAFKYKIFYRDSDFILDRTYDYKKELKYGVKHILEKNK